MAERLLDRIRDDVALGRLNAAHAPAMVRWMRDPEVSRNLGLRQEPSLDRTLGWIAHVGDDPSIRVSTILLAGQHVGNVVLDRIDHYLGTARLSVYVGESAARGAGIGSGGMYLALAEAFDVLKLHKVWLTVHLENHRAIAAYARLGFVLEGILRDEFILDGQRLGAAYMGLLRREFDRLPPRLAQQGAGP